MAQPNSKKHTMPPSAVASLRDSWMRLQGVIMAANAIQVTLTNADSMYKQHFASCLDMMGLDPTDDWQIDFRTGELSLKGKEAPVKLLAKDEALPDE
jgi:hypothetical protein